MFRSSTMLFLPFFTQLLMLKSESKDFIRHQNSLNTFPVQMPICVHFPIYRAIEYIANKIDEFFLTASRETAFKYKHIIV